MTQNEMVLNWLKKSPIGPMEALRELGVYRLASRINDLRDKGHHIETTWDYVTDRYGEERRVARYTLKEIANGSTPTDQAQVRKSRARQKESSTPLLDSLFRVLSVRGN